MHNWIVVDYEDWDPNPHVGELQLRELMSFMRNQLKWKNVVTFIEKLKWESSYASSSICYTYGNELGQISS